MNKVLPAKNYSEETEKITSFLKKTFEEQKISKAVIGVSGGIDSATSLFLTVKSIDAENVIALHLPYTDEHINDFKLITSGAKIPEENIKIISIKNMADTIASQLNIKPESLTSDKVRFGNIAARTRMIVLFDEAKRENALVVGTENKSENLLSYFTRFGDEASDIEPIHHLFKTEIFGLANFLGIPEKIVKKTPTAGLWKGQTDEGEFGFSYEEADQVLFLYFEKKQSLEEIKKMGLKNAVKIINRVKSSEFKRKVPYKI